jgi:hypothetical protein
MKRNLITILSLVVMSLMCNATSAFAQAYAKANVPFAFNVGGAQLPAGTYEIKVLGQSPYEIMIENCKTRAAAVSIARREGPRNSESKLVFNHVDNRYFLSEVWKDSAAGGMIVPTSKQEEELKRELSLAKSLSNGHDKVVIALK